MPQRVVVIDPFRGTGACRNSHGAPEARQLPRIWTRGRRETESREERTALRVRSQIMQNKMKGVLGRMIAGAS